MGNGEITTLNEVGRLPSDYTSFYVKGVVDGDTYKISSGSVRVQGINTLEMGKGPTPDSRLDGAEKGAVEAKRFLEELISGQRVFINLSKRDGYGRILSPTYIEFRNRPRTYVDLSAVMLMEGWAHVFVLVPSDVEDIGYYLGLMEWAEAFGLGLWADGKFPELKITSFHPNAEAVQGDEEPVEGEYLRIANASTEEVDLDEYYLLNYTSRLWFRLPHCIVPPGRTVMIVTGGVESQCDPENEIIISLDMDKPFWENEDEGGACAVILDYAGKNVVTSASKYGSRCP